MNFLITNWYWILIVGVLATLYFSRRRHNTVGAYIDGAHVHAGHGYNEPDNAGTIESSGPKQTARRRGGCC